MELKLKPLETTKGKKTMSPILDNLEQVDCLKALQREFNDLDNEMFLHLVSICYNFKLDDEDFKKILKIFLKSDNIQKGLLRTTMAIEYHHGERGPICSEWYDVWSLDAIVYYTDASGLDFKHFYTKEELEELIKSKKIVFKDFSLRCKLRDIDRLDEEKAKENMAFLPFKRVSLMNLGIYEDIIIRSIKRKLQDKRLAHDICKLIDTARRDISRFASLALKVKKRHEKAAERQQTIYSDCMTYLTELTIDKEDYRARSRTNPNESNKKIG